MICSSVSPGTYSMTMKKTSSCFSAVSTVTMFGWLIDASSRGSFSSSLKSSALLVRNLERDFLVDPGVFGQIDGAEAAAAERREDAVLADGLTAEEHRCAREYS